VPHQIDVQIERAGNRHRMLIECKDFDISGDPVGLDILRSFRSVIEDNDANEGIVITCNRFTSDAAKYAKSKGIKLAVLRLFETKDMVGRFHKVGVTFHVLSAAKPSVQLFISEDDGALFHKQIKEIGVQAEISLRDQVFIVEEG
jgi:hypothetical protein